MKKMLCMILALVMALSLAVPAMADTYSQGTGAQTQATYNATGIDDPDDGEDDVLKEKFYYVEVPATLTVGGNSGNVKAWGLWKTSEMLTVAVANANNIVALSETGGTGTCNATVTFGGISVAGLTTINTTSANPAATETISVAFAAGQTAPASGSWAGTINYTVTLA